MLDHLKDYNIILASQSPRRYELLEKANIPFKVLVVPGVSEDFPPSMAVDDVAEFLALQKQNAYKQIWSNPLTIVITADTVVELNGKILNKPLNRLEALNMLNLLSGNRHRVLTGVVIKSAEKEQSFTVVTEVWFNQLSNSDIEYYVDNFEPYDKAGAYGVQEWIGLIGVREIKGSFYNIMGLPVAKLYEELGRF